MAEDYKQFDSPVSDKIPIVPSLVKKVTSIKLEELVLILALSVVSITCIVFIILYSVGGKPNVVEELCVTAPCLKSASYVVRNMNKSVNPCTNFYKYACGGFQINNPLDSETYSKTVYSKLYYENEEKLKKILEAPVIDRNQDSAEKKVKDMFASCTNTYYKERAKGYPLLKKVFPNTGGWYVLGTWNNSTWDMQTALEKVTVDFWTSALFTCRVITDWGNTNKRVLELDMSGMSMYWFYYMHPEDRKYTDDLKKFMRLVATMLVRDSNMTIENSTQKIETFVNDAYTIEYNLANITMNTVPSIDPHAHENRVSLRDFTSQTGNVIDFSSIMTYMFSDANVTPNTKVIVHEVEWITMMTAMVGNLGPNKNRMLNNYFTWKLMHRYAQDLSWEYVHANREFYVDRYGIPQFLGTWYYCFYSMNRYMGDALGSLYVKDHFADKNKEKVHEILNYVKSAMADSFTRNAFMDKPTKDLAREKIMTSLDKMGYPDFMMNDGSVNSIYSSLKIVRNDYFANLLSINKFIAKDWNNKLAQPDDKARWTLTTYSTVMMYMGPWHELIVPAGLLQFPIYDYTLPHFMNFGSMGSLLAHYLIHAIDQYGSRYNTKGEFNFLGWWSNQTKITYNKTRNCFVDFFNNKTMGPYNVPGQFSPQTIPVKGRYFANEGIAIASGLRLSFQAYQRWVSMNIVEKAVPGVGLTNDQMFFVSFAQSTCYNMNDNYAYNRAVRGYTLQDIRYHVWTWHTPGISFAAPMYFRSVLKRSPQKYL